MFRRTLGVIVSFGHTKRPDMSNVHSIHHIRRLSNADGSITMFPVNLVWFLG
jgi:hypothetical protein